jgi:polysaccharide deacetylase family protein (PEP-CTERM system associated)
MAAAATFPVTNAPNILSVDVEDYFHVEAFSDVIDRSQWDSYPCRVEANTRRVLDLFDELGVKGTFFILGWVAERYPRLVQEIARRGHPTASHSYWHRLVYNLTPEEFRSDTLRSKDLIEQAAGQPAIGYRAPSFSITARSAWALDILTELGFAYDSSIFPVKHDFYGVPNAPRAPFQVSTPSGPIVEFPMSTFRVGNSPNLPVAGGGYLRMLPYWYTRMGVHRACREGLPIISYIHPWEFDPEQPRVAGRLRSRLRHYTNLAKTAGRMRKLIQLGNFTSFEESGLVNSDHLQHVTL